MPSPHKIQNLCMYILSIHTSVTSWSEKKSLFSHQRSKERQWLLETEVAPIFVNQLGRLNFEYRLLRSLTIPKTFRARGHAKQFELFNLQSHANSYQIVP